MIRWLVLLVALAAFSAPAGAEDIVRLDVVRAEAAPDRHLGMPTVTIWLSPESQAVFTRFSSEHVGTRFDLLVDGVVIVSPMLQSVITQDQLLLTGMNTGKSASKLAYRLNEGSSIVGVRPSAD